MVISRVIMGRERFMQWKILYQAGSHRFTFKHQGAGFVRFSLLHVAREPIFAGVILLRLKR